jgi:threonine/homoserine/homoserine lactone efflux protein
MRILWTLLKVAIGLMLAVPLAIIALGLTIGVLGVVFALAVLSLKLACVGLIAYGAFRIARRLLTSKAPPVAALRELGAPRDHYYEAAMRELDVELGPTSR